MRQTKLNGWYEYYRTPCVICGSTGGCMINEEGTAVACIRVESEKFFSKNSALPSYLHLLKGNQKQKIDKNEIEKIYISSKKQGGTVLNEVYHAFLNCLELEDDHYEHLTSPSRELNDLQVITREYRSFPERPWETVKMMEDNLNLNDFTGIPGFYKRDNKYWTIAGSRGILIPFRNHYNQIMGFQYRIDNPPNVVEVKENKKGLMARIKEQPGTVQIMIDGELISEMELKAEKKWITISHDGTLWGWIRVVKGNRYFWLSSVNKPQGTGSGDPAPVHVAIPSPKLANWQTGELLKAKTIWLSEGPLKCDIASDCIEKLYDPLEIEDIGTTFLALPGVGAWRLAIPIMKEMGVEKVNICFDADAVSNPHVKKHLLECAKVLKEEGFSANLILWNEDDGKGIDDIFLQSKLPHIKKLF